MRDLDIRNILKATLLNNYYNDSTCKVVEELDIPAAKARIDMAVINGHMHGYEIKSARDTLKRIPSQLDAYSKVFDYLSIVTEPRYEAKLLDIVPSWVGIYTCKEYGEVLQIRASSLNKEKESFFVAKLLWKEELHEILKANEVKFKKSNRNWLLCEALAENVPIEILANQVRQKLKSRIDWK